MKAVLVYADGRSELIEGCNGAHWWMVPLPLDERKDPDEKSPFVQRYRPFVMVDPAVGESGKEMFVYIEQPWEHFQSPKSAGGVTVTSADKETR